MRTTKHISIFIFFFLIFSSCDNLINDLDKSFAPGSGIGMLADTYSDSTYHKWKDHYLNKYFDTLIKYYPKYKIPTTLNTFIVVYGSEKNQVDTQYKFENYPFTNRLIYFDAAPKEIYYLQWGGGTGFQIRTAYDLETDKFIIENYRTNTYIDTNVKSRIKARFVNEIYKKLDSLLLNSTDKDSALYKLD